MKLTIEVVADTRSEIEILLRDAVREVRGGHERSGVDVNHCMGDFRITVEDEPEPTVPFAPGDRVTCTDPESAYYRLTGTVEHSGPKMTGVRWAGTGDKCIKDNAFLVATPPGETCPVCRGSGIVQVAFEKACANCRGSGRVPSIASLAASQTGSEEP